MTFTIRKLAAALFTLAGASIAQAGEVSEAPMAASMKSRAEVAAEARMAPATNELYDGREQAVRMALPMRSREAVRTEARAAAKVDPQLYTGG